eukprot:245842-Chlamydomonas_euryale.AAC.2
MAAACAPAWSKRAPRRSSLTCGGGGGGGAAQQGALWVRRLLAGVWNGMAWLGVEQERSAPCMA